MTKVFRDTKKKIGVKMLGKLLMKRSGLKKVVIVNFLMFKLFWNYL